MKDVFKILLISLLVSAAMELKFGGKEKIKIIEKEIIIKEKITQKQKTNFDRLCDHVKKFESFSPIRYNDAHGYSIGYGHLIKKSDKLPSIITKEQADSLFYIDIMQKYNYIMSVKGIQNYSECQILALTSFVYNVGEGNFNKSTIKKIIQQKKKGNIYEEMLKWVWAYNPKTKKKEKQKGLLRRRIAEANIYLNGF